MSTCDHRLLDARDGLACTRETHADGGHTYVASDAPDRHTNEPTDD